MILSMLRGSAVMLRLHSPEMQAVLTKG